MPRQRDGGGKGDAARYEDDAPAWISFSTSLALRAVRRTIRPSRISHETPTRAW